MNSQKSTSYKYLFIFITIILILIGCTVKNDIKTSPTSREITSAQDEPAKLLKDINLTKSGNQNTVTLLANNTLTYTVFKLSKPDRILIDLQDITAAPGLTSHFRRWLHDRISRPIPGISLSSNRCDARERVGIEGPKDPVGSS